MTTFSRHAKRRMKLYGITEEDVTRVLENGKKEILSENKTSYIYEIANRFEYPLKVVASETSEQILVITAYPLKKGRK